MDAPKTSLFTVVLILAVLLGIIIGYFILSIIRHQRRNLALQKQTMLAEITSMEKERARIASDLHDELGPMLSAVKMKLSSFELNDPDDQYEAQRTNDHIDSLMKRMREISFDLMPAALLNKGLLVAVGEFVDFVTKDDALRIEFTRPKSLDLPESYAIHLYRMIQEVIHNTVKHARASLLTIHIEEEERLLKLKMADNGIGFDQKDSDLRYGLGLRNILSRTDILNGTLYLDSAPDKGTSYSFEIPLP